MEQECMVLKFRDLFTALEVCANIDGIERKDVAFDKEVSKLLKFQLPFFPSTIPHSGDEQARRRT
jgi:hypothetical protein